MFMTVWIARHRFLSLQFLVCFVKLKWRRVVVLMSHGTDLTESNRRLYAVNTHTSYDDKKNNLV